jgi:protoheme IX farnesyltransferase
VILVALTLLPVTFGALGPLYLVAASLLGGGFLFGVIRLAAATDITVPARFVWRYSLMYLALLFAAMTLDRVFTR